MTPLRRPDPDDALAAPWAGAAVRRPAPAWRRWLRADQRFAVQLLLPAFLTFLVFQLYPIAKGVVTSLYRFGIATPVPVYVGLQNYLAVITDSIFTTVVIPNTLLFTGLTVATEVVLGVGVAVAINKHFPGEALVRTLLILPLTVSPVISGFMFKWLFNDQFGLVNVLLETAGFTGLAWMSERWTAFFVMYISDVWSWTPLFVLVVFAALQTAPRAPYEAAWIDGAREWAVFWHVTVPFIAPVLLVMSIVRTFDAFRAFDLVWTVTGGGPGRSTEVFGVYTYKEAFQYLNYGKGAAVALLGTAVMCLAGLFTYRLFARITRYERIAAYTEGEARGFSGRLRTTPGRLAFGALVTGITVLGVLPMAYLILTAFRPPADVYYVLQGGWNFSLVNFVNAARWENLPLAFANTALVATVATVLSLVIALPSGYMLARYRTWTSETWFFLLYLVRAIPYIAWLLPLFLLVHDVGLYDRYWGVILPHAAVHITFFSWVGRGFFEGVPVDMEEAALIDGSSRWGAFLRIALPQVVPGILALGMLGWLYSWNELLFSLILTGRQTPMLTPTIAQFVNEMGVEWGTMSAAGALALVPAILIALFGQRYIVRGLGGL
jgi:ABC-type sugar transport system permease subunit